MNTSNAARDVIERPRDRLTVQILANGRPRFEEKSETTQKDERGFLRFVQVRRRRRRL